LFIEKNAKINKEEKKMKKVMIVAGCMAMTLALSTMSFGIDLTPQQAETIKNPVSGAYVPDVKGGTVISPETATAYRPAEWDTILRAYGLTLADSMVKDLPRGYATTTNGKITFSEQATAFSPQQYHAIFTAYGLLLDAACIQKTIGSFGYATAVSSDGKVTLGDKATAFTGLEYAAILHCYYLPTVEKKVVVEPEHTGWVMASDYLFDFDKSVIKKKYYSKLDEIAVQIKKDPRLRVEVQGHTDSVGTDKYNMGLSLRRANAVRDYFIKKSGIAANRLTAVGFGESKSVATNETAEGRAQNRRVELKPIK
jgi:OOP family OmpA-OmpF porin